MKYIKHILSETIFLLPYLLMGVSFLSIIYDWIGLNFDKNFWCNLGGYSLFTNIIFVYVLTLNKSYCYTTRLLPISMTLVSVYNIIASFFPERYAEYEKYYEVIILSVTLLVGIILCINKKLNK